MCCTGVLECVEVCVINVILVMLQCVAVCCSVLQCVAGVLECVDVCHGSNSCSHAT